MKLKGAFSRMRGEIPTVINCPCCGEQATVNVYVDQAVVIDYFYECCCGCTIEPDEIDQHCPHCGEQATPRFFTDDIGITDGHYNCEYCDRIAERHTERRGVF